MTDHFDPLRSLKESRWFKLICGASFQHLPAVRNLALAYTLAGADCIDVAADPAVIAVVQEALQVARELTTDTNLRGFSESGKSPLLMVSLNDGEDPHFRKAEFNSTQCPTDCPRPCESICPAQAIVFNSIKDDFSGVISPKCYGCGRCIPVCPYDIIDTKSYVSSLKDITPLILSAGVDAIEIHTNVGHLAEFKRLWEVISPWVERLKLLSISCPDGDGMIDYLHTLSAVIAPLPCVLIWQTDGRPMSGDIGDGTTHAAVKLGQKVLAAKLPGYVQLAGGTNSYTVSKLKAMKLLKGEGSLRPRAQARSPLASPFGRGLANATLTQSPAEGNPPAALPHRAEVPDLEATGVESGRGGEWERWRVGEEWENFPSSSCSPLPHSIAGVAYGSYARRLLSPIIEQLEAREVNKISVKATVHLEEEPELLWQAVGLAHSLVSQLKSHS